MVGGGRSQERGTGPLWENNNIEESEDDLSLRR